MIARGLAAALVCVISSRLWGASPTQLGELALAYRDSPSAARRAAVVAFAKAHARDQTGALADLALAVGAFENKDYAGAAAAADRASRRLPQLADYAIYFRGAALDAQNDAAGALAALGTLKEFTALGSPLLAKTAIIAAKDALKTGGGAGMAAVAQALRGRYATLSQPEGDFALALAFDASGDGAQAATYYQRVYFLFPATKMAEEASAAMSRLKASLGANYPPPLPAQMLDRGDRWIRAREFSKARAEFQSIAPQLGGVERDQARVRIGAAQLAAGDYRGAYTYLKALDMPRSEADAERYNYLVECARHMNDDDAMMDAIKQLGRHHERSVWRLKALVTAGNRYLVAHEAGKYDPLFRAAAYDFPADPATAYCHWKITWDAYIGGKREAALLLKEQVERHADDPRAASALYYLGRTAEYANDFNAARSYYSRLVDLFPNYYYAVLARVRLAQSHVVAAAVDRKVEEWLNAIEFPTRADYSEQTPNAATKARIERARLLVSAGLADYAETEMRFGARTDGQPHLLAMELAKTDAAPYLSLRHMKSLSPDYLTTPVDKAPPEFWKMLFPLPYQRALEASAEQQNLDPFMVAALIRQESEFNPEAHSHANAYGLTQIVPATGRSLARKQGMRRFSANSLYQPETNLKLGTQYLRSLLDQWNGRWEQTLASYNAGKSRAVEWMAWGNFREPSEFVESIPFTETREYVQAVIRNAALYKQIYGNHPPPMTETQAVRKAAPARKAVVKKKRRKKK